MLKLSLGLNAVFVLLVAVLWYERFAVGVSFTYYRKAVALVASASVEELRQGHLDRVREALSKIEMGAINDGLRDATAVLKRPVDTPQEPNQAPEPTRGARGSS